MRIEMVLFYDFEMTGLHKNTTPISIGIVSEDGKKFYAEFADYDRNQCNDWILENVIAHMRFREPMFEEYAQDFVRINNIGKGEAYIPYDRPKSHYIITSDKNILYEKTYSVFHAKIDEKGNAEVFGDCDCVRLSLVKWISQFDTIQFVSDVCHYDFVLLIDLLTNGGTALDLPDNISAVCHDTNQDTAAYFEVSDRDAFDMNREEILDRLTGYRVVGEKHNSLHDAEIIKEIYEEIGYDF